MAAEPRAQHSPIGRSGAVSVALRSTVLREPGRGGRIRRPSARRRDSRGRRPPAGAHRIERRCRRAGRGPAARQPARGGGAFGDGFRRSGALAGPAAAVDFSSSRRWRPPRRARLFEQALRHKCAGGFRAPDRRSGANRADRRRRRARRLRDGESGSGIVQAAHDRGVPFGGPVGLGRPPPESGQIQVFFAAESTCRSSRRRRVFSGARSHRSRSERNS